MTEDRIQQRMDRGSAMMYRTRPVKFKRRKMFPAKPQAMDIEFQRSSLE